MRELKECTAEVFRRSEQRIRERRRKRNRVLALCVPVILIAAVWSAMSLPAVMPEGGTMGQDRFGESAGSAPESVACPYSAVEIQAGGIIPEHYGEVTDRLAVAEMFSSVNSLFADDVGNGQNVIENFPSEEENPNFDLSDLTGSRKDCTITFTAEDGSQAVYTLSGNTLVDVNENKTISLSGSQMAELMAVLGLSE